MKNNQSALDLIGLASVELAKMKLAELVERDDVDRLRFNGFDPELLVICFNSLARSTTLRSPENFDSVELWLTKSLIQDPADIVDKSILTDETPANLRNRPNAKRLKIFANGSDDLTRDTLSNVPSVTETELSRNSKAFIEALAVKYPSLNDSGLKKQIRCMFSALTQNMSRSLPVLSEFLICVAEILVTGETIANAVNASLNLLGYPHFRDAMPDEKDWLDENKWKETFELIQTIPSKYFAEKRRPYDVDRSKLNLNLQAIQGDIDETTFEIYDSIVRDTGKHGWEELIELDWESNRLKQFITAVPGKEKPLDIAEATRECFEKYNVELLRKKIQDLDRTVKDYLNHFGKEVKLTEDQLIDARYFFREVKEAILNYDPKLYRRWDKLLYSEKIEGSDFIDCLLRASNLLSQRVNVKLMKNPVLTLRCIHTSKVLFHEKNADLIEYFALCYRGLEKQCADFVSMDFTFKPAHNPLFHYHEVKHDLKLTGTDKSTSLSKEALSLDFDVFLTDRGTDSDRLKAKTIRLHWSLPKDCMALSLPKDWPHLSAKKNDEGSSRAYACDVIYGRNFKQTNTKGLISEISLDDSSSFGLTSNCFLDQNLEGNSLTDLKAHLSTVFNETNFVGIEKVRSDWKTFSEAYKKALADVELVGFGASSIPAMNEAYERLLRTVCKNAHKSQDFRERVLSYLLSIGVFSFVDQNSAYAVVTPWQPLRLCELHRSFVAKMNLIKLNVTGAASLDPRSEVLRSLEEKSTRLEPSFVVVPTDTSISADKTCLEVLAPIQHASGYTLYSRIAGPDCRDSSTNVSAAKELADIVVEHYSEQVPNASNHYSILLADSVSKEFPTAVINALIRKLSDNEKLGLKVGGLNAHEYRADDEERLYQGLTLDLSRQESVEEAALASVSLRSSVGISVTRRRDELSINEKNYRIGIKPYDVAFVDRFFTYSAQNRWVSLPRRSEDCNPYDLNDLLQQRSNRLVQLENEYISTTLLCGDSVSTSGHEYINAACWLGQNKSAENGDEFEYPCLQVNCRDAGVEDTIQQLHKLAHWVVTINDYIDRRQLLNSNIKIVRYKGNPQTGRTSIISSEMPPEVLSNRIAERIDTICGGALKKRAADIAGRILRSSYDISGYLALRAAKEERRANEVIGLVLSNWLAQQALNAQATAAGEHVLASTSYLLDDYAPIFKYARRLSDLLCVVVAKKGERCKLHLVVTEAKFVSDSIRSKEERESADQTAATYNMLSAALRDSPEARPDRPIWLARLADFVTSLSKSDRVDASLSSKELFLFADAVKQGEFDLTLDRVSHVFAYDNKKPIVVDEDVKTSSGTIIKQISFGENATKDMLVAFADGSCSAEVQKALDCCLLDPIPLVKRWNLPQTFGIEQLSKHALPDVCMDEEEESAQQATPQGFSINASGTPEQTRPTQSLSKTNVEPVPSRPMHDVPQEQIAEAALAPSKAMELSDDAAANRPAKQETTEKSVPAPVQVSTSIESPETSPAFDLDHMTFAPYFARFVQSRQEGSHASPEREAWARKAAQKLQMMFVQKGMRAKLLGNPSLTPNGALVTFDGESELETGKILSLKEKLLTAHSIDIIFVLPQPGCWQILITDGSGKRETVSMWDMWKKRKVEKRYGGVNLSFVVGMKETDGEILYLNPIEQDPHTLIAGTTGSGKTVLMQTLLLDMAATNPSTKLRFYIIDPKGGPDYFPLRRLPHLAAPFVTDPDEAIKLLKFVVDEMNRRKGLFAPIGAKDLRRYNAMVPSEKQLPVIFLIHDELPQWMVVKEYRQAVTETLTQLATMSRSCGIYLIFLAQRPDKDVMSMQVRANLGNRLVLKLDAATSEIALGGKGAETLLGKGHLAAKLGGRVYYAQGPYLDEDKGEIEDAVDAIIAGDKEWTHPFATSDGNLGTQPLSEQTADVETTAVPSAPVQVTALVIPLPERIDPASADSPQPSPSVNQSSSAANSKEARRSKRTRTKMVPLSSFDPKRLNELQSERMDLQVYLVRASGRSPEKALTCPIWCLALYDNKSYHYWWRRIGSEPATVSPAGDRQFIIGLIGLGASVRHIDLTGTDKPGNNAFVAAEQDDFIIDGVSVRHLMEKRGRGAEMPTEERIREKAREILAFVEQQKNDPASVYLRPNAVGRLQELGAMRHRAYTVKL